MNEFVYSYPTKVYFGKKTAVDGLAKELAGVGQTVMLAPAVSAEHTASLFERMADAPQGAVRFALNNVRRLKQDGLHRIYRMRKDM